MLRSKSEAQVSGVPICLSVEELPADITHIVDCAGHQGLTQHGPSALRRGLDVITVSIGALADQHLSDELKNAAVAGNSRLHLASGAIGALDALRAAKCGKLDRVCYVGRKPPKGWLGSPAEEKLDLNGQLKQAQTHFTGSAREAALRYPKNANVAAAVALAGLGFDKTGVELIADPNVNSNIHELHALGDFGNFEFRISGNSLPDNPRSSALAAMSVVASILETQRPIRS